MGFLGNYFPGLRVNALDLSPNYAASIISIVNGAGSLTGILVPAFVGFMTPDVRPGDFLFPINCLCWRKYFIYTRLIKFQSTLEQWRTVFWVAFAVAMVRIVIYSIWASGEVQPWNNPIAYQLAKCDVLTDHTKHTFELNFKQSQ